MATDFPAKTPKGKRRLRIRTLMILVAVAALTLGFLAQVARTARSHHADSMRFFLWMADFYGSNWTIKPMGAASNRFTANPLFGLTTNWTQLLLTPTRKVITVQANFRTGPSSSVREVTFESSGRTVTWPFEDIEAGRKFDLKAEFPEAFR